ncbi:MAG: hypothetical protein ABIB71_01785 [Candidatus Woesearchaeota archaeon]
MKKTFALLVIILMAFSFTAFADDEVTEEVPTEPVAEEEAQPEPEQVIELPPEEEPTQQDPVHEEPVIAPPPEPRDQGCWSGDQRVPCPEPVAQPQPVREDIPSGCHKIILDNGMEIVECEKDCKQIPEDAIRKCEEAGGYPNKRMDPRGCPFFECGYRNGRDEPSSGFTGGRQECPSHEDLEMMKDKCTRMNMKTIAIREGNCEFIKCGEGQHEFENKCPEDMDPEISRRIKEECMSRGDRIVKKFDPNGCQITVCAPQGENFDCPMNVPPEAYEKCEMEGGSLIVKKDETGCIRYVDCARRGNGEIAYEEVEEIPPAAKLLEIALKLESLKIQFDKLARKVRGIANYYEDNGDTAEADRFRRAAGIFEGAKSKIDEVKAKLREGARDMSEDDLRNIKHDIKYIGDVVMQDALYIILGGEISLEGSSGVTAEGYTDCGSDERCWQEAFRLCEPIVYKPSGSGIMAKIRGLEGELCILEAEVVEGEYEGYDMICKISNYATAVTNGPPDFLHECEGPLVGMIQEMVAEEKTPQLEIRGRLKERVYDVKERLDPREKAELPEPSLYKPKDTCGDGHCEKFSGEDRYNCYEDCWVMCVPEDQRQFEACQEKGGKAHSDPTHTASGEKCDVYKGCTMPNGEFIAGQGWEGGGYEKPIPKDAVFCTPNDKLKIEDCSRQGGMAQKGVSAGGCVMYKGCEIKEQPTVQEAPIPQSSGEVSISSSGGGGGVATSSSGGGGGGHSSAANEGGEY